MRNSFFCFFILIALSASPAFCQSIAYDAELNLRGLVSSGEELPFWMYHNQRGRIAENTNVAGWVSGSARYSFYDDTFVELKAGALYRNGTADAFVVDELYAHYETFWFYATAGRKQQPELYSGLSASNRSLLWSLNARPLPGLQIGSNQPLFLSGTEGLGVELSWAEYLLEKDRFVSKANLHHKSAFLVYEVPDKWIVKAGIQHYAQWAGTSPDRDYAEDLPNYLRAISSRGGNSLGSYEAYITKKFRNFTIELIYNYPFEDMYGAKLNNLPDGRYGIYLQRKDRDHLLNSFIYEFYTTHSQGYAGNSAAFNNYFNHDTYRSGWTYEDRVLGTPFFTVNPDGEGIINNKFNAHHLGLGGQTGGYFNTYPYRILLSYAYNDGTYLRRIRPKEHVFYGFFDARVLQTGVELNVQAGVEFGSNISPIYGIGAQLTYRL